MEVWNGFKATAKWGAKGGCLGDHSMICQFQIDN